jgi:hypothetical protein
MISARELRLLRAYLVASAIALVVLLVGAFSPARQDEITVQRINVIESDGTLRLVIANRERSPAPVIRGKTFGFPGGNRAGIVFYNEEGTESGGLITSGRRLPDGTYYQGLGLTFDRFDQDQVVALQHNDENGRLTSALTIFDRPALSLDSVHALRRAIDSIPEGAAKQEALRRWRERQGGMEYSAPRFFAGRTRARASVVNLYDPAGRLRLRLSVDSLGSAGIEFLDDSGRVIRKIMGVEQPASQK